MMWQEAVAAAASETFADATVLTTLQCIQLFIYDADGSSAHKSTKYLPTYHPTYTILNPKNHRPVRPSVMTLISTRV